MKYVDTDGDVWEESGDGRLTCVASSVAGYEGTSHERDHVEQHHGPLRPLVALTEDAEPPSDGLPTVSDVMSRATVFQTAHALVTGLKWDDSEKASVYDVLSVAKWLEGEA